MLILTEIGASISVKEIIIQILSEEWPLPLKSLHWKIAREHGKSISFQATHKALNKLVEQNILVKNEKRYRLNLAWLEQLSSFGTETKQAYLESGELLECEICAK